MTTEWPLDHTMDGVEITPGLEVRDYNYELTTVVSLHHTENEYLRGIASGRVVCWWNTANGGLFDGDRLLSVPKPTWEKPCEKCGRTIARYRGGGDVSCECGAQYNAAGQRLRDRWSENPAWRDDDIDDMEGYELECLRREGAL